MKKLGKGLETKEKEPRTRPAPKRATAKRTPKPSTPKPDTTFCAIANNKCLADAAEALKVAKQLEVSKVVYIDQRFFQFKNKAYWLVGSVQL